MTHQQRDAEIVLELPDLQAECRLRDPQLIGGPRHVADLDDLHEITQLAEIDGVLLSTTAPRIGSPAAGERSSAGRLSQLEMDVLFLREAQQFLQTFLATDARLLDAAERRAEEMLRQAVACLSALATSMAPRLSSPPRVWNRCRRRSLGKAFARLVAGRSRACAAP
jgi:hypothetical protein